MSENDSRQTDFYSIADHTAPSAGVVVLPDGTRPIPLGSGRITGLLGEGGMAIVYEIWNEQLGIRRAVKLMRPNSAVENRGRILTEARITAQLDHPNVINIYSVGEWNGLPYIEMERIDGGTLSAVIAQFGALPMELCAAISSLVAAALDYTHRHEINGQHQTGILHRDLKPGNIMISRKGVVRITDFGIATPATMAGTATSSGKVVGSMQYLAPEQLEEQEASVRSDIFAFGCVMYEMLTGEKAFPEKNISRLIRKRLDNDYIPLASYKIAIPKRLRLLVEQCMQRNPARRPASMRAVSVELSRIWERLSVKRPEEIISTFVQSGTYEKQILFPVRRIPRWVIALGIAGILATASLPLGIYYHENQVLIRVQFAMFMEDMAKRLKGDLPSPSGPAAVATAAPKVVKAAPPPAVTLSTPASTPAVTAAAAEKPSQKPAAGPSAKREPEKATASTAGKNASANAVSSASAAPTLLDTLSREYGTRDIMSLLGSEDSKRHFDNVLSLYAMLPPDMARVKEARLYRHRALVGTSRVNRSYFDNNNINDGEFYLSKAQYLYNTEQFQAALWILGTIKASPLALTDRGIIEREVLAYTARCNTALYEATPDDGRLETAMRAWFEVKNAFRADQNHPYFAEANRNIRVLSRKE